MTYQFNAFISYSREDRDIAASLEKLLENYRIPKRYRIDRKRLLIFRDVEDVNLGELSEVFENALDSSDFLLVLCSPASRRSAYVNEEIRHFGNRCGRSKIIPVVIHGRPDQEVNDEDAEQNQAFPPALYKFFDTPLAADWRRRPQEARRDRINRLREAKFQIIAKLLYTSKTEKLVGRERAKRRILGALSAILVSIAIGSTSWWYYDAIPKSGIRLSEISSDEEWGPRTRDRIGALRLARKEMIPSKRNWNQLLVASWNIRDFGSTRYQLRSKEALAYIAEVISSFDVIALQELSGSNVDFENQLDVVKELLGRHWQLVISGVTEGQAGNRERLGYLFDSRKLSFGGFTDEVVLSEQLLAAHKLDEQIARTPFMAGFDFRGIRLLFCNVHIYFGAPSGVRMERRIKEREAIANYLAVAQDNGRSWGNHLFLVGDFNTVTPSDDAISMFQAYGFEFPADSEQLATNYAITKPYDQIMTRFPEISAKLQPLNSGVFNFFQVVYRNEDSGVYADEMKSIQKRSEHSSNVKFEQWRTFAMSDHLPKWVLFTTNL